MEASHFGELLGLEHRACPPGTAIVELPLSPALCNRFGTVHGGVVLALMDVAGLWAGATTEGAPPHAATVSLTCNFLRSARLAGEQRLHAVARVKKRGRSLIFAEIDIHLGADGPVLASGQGVYSVAGSAPADKTG